MFPTVRRPKSLYVDQVNVGANVLVRW